MDDMDDDDLLEALGVSVETKTTGGRTPRQERVIAGFEDILDFVKEHGRPPVHGEDRDIFERLYAVRLDRLRAEQEFRDLLAPFDDAGLLSGEIAARPAAPEPADDDALLAECRSGRCGRAFNTEARQAACGSACRRGGNRQPHRLQGL